MREPEGTDKPEVKFTPHFKCKEKQEDKVIDFIDLTTGQMPVEIAPPPPSKDYVITQEKTIWQAMKRSQCFVQRCETTTGI